MKKVLILAFAIVLLAAGISFATIVGSKHDMTATQYFSTQNSTISACQYCHTPHLRNNPAIDGAPLWNRAMPTITYTVYGDGTTMGGTTVNQPGNNSKTCLSCHDGTIALGAVLVGNGGTVEEASGRPNFIQGGKLVDSVATDTGTYPGLGTNLKNDHPVGFIFVANRAGVTSISAPFKLYNGSFECASCHDPHETADGKQPFLRANKATICTDCHSQK